MTTLLVTVAFLNIGLLVMLLVRYQPQNGVPQRGAESRVTYAMPVMPQTYAMPAAPPAPKEVPATVPLSQEDMQPLYDEAARQLDRRLDRLERLIREAEGVSRALEERVAAAREASLKGFAPGLPTRHAKVRFLNNAAVRRILDLADSGMTPVGIARELGRGVDEITMTMNLRQMTG